MQEERRRFIKQFGALAAAASIVPGAVANDMLKRDTAQQSASSRSHQKYSKEVQQMVQNTCCIDMLGSFIDPYHMRNGKPLANIWLKSPGSFSSNDYSFVKSTGLNVFGWGEMHPTFEDMLEFVAAYNGLVASNPRYFARIDNRKSLDTLHDNGKIGVLITNQNSSHFRSVEDVELFYGLGQRVSQLTYNDKNDLGCGAFVDEDSGLTSYGKEIIRRMNEVGMGVDVSHCGDRTTMDAINCAEAPVLITHGACRGIAKGVARAKTDEAIKAMAKTGGVIGIPILRFMIRNQEPVELSHFLDHIDYVTQLVGIDHVGIGSDQCLYTEETAGIDYCKNRLENAPPKYQTHSNDKYMISIENLNHPFRTYDIAEGLLRRKYDEKDIQKVLGGNFKRALEKIFKH